MEKEDLVGRGYQEYTIRRLGNQFQRMRYVRFTLR